MKMPEQIKEALKSCAADRCDCCIYRNCAGDCVELLCTDALSLVDQLEEQVMLMKIQMHGDCGVCKHRSEQEAVFRKAAKKGEFAFTQRCEDCIKNGKSAWEYEGLPELPKKGATT